VPPLPATLVVGVLSLELQLTLAKSAQGTKSNQDFFILLRDVLKDQTLKIKANCRPQREPRVAWFEHLEIGAHSSHTGDESHHLGAQHRRDATNQHDEQDPSRPTACARRRRQRDWRDGQRRRDRVPRRRIPKKILGRDARCGGSGQRLGTKVAQPFRWSRNEWRNPPLRRDIDIVFP